MKLREYQIEDARAVFEEYARLLDASYDVNSRVLIKRFVEMMEEWIEDERREPVTYTHRQHPVPSSAINPYGDQP